MVETTNFHPDSEPMTTASLRNGDAKVTERFTRTSATELDYQYTDCRSHHLHKTDHGVDSHDHRTCSRSHHGICVHRGRSLYGSLDQGHHCYRPKEESNSAATDGSWECASPTKRSEVKPAMRMHQTVGAVVILAIGTSVQIKAQGTLPYSLQSNQQVASSLSAEQVETASSAWTKKTAWGDPDLQAIWNDSTAHTNAA